MQNNNGALGLNDLLSGRKPKSEFQTIGSIRSVRGALLSAELPGVALGDLCYITRREAPPLNAEVVALQENSALLAPLGTTHDVVVGAKVDSYSKRLTIPVSEALLGRIVDPFCNPIDRKVLNIERAPRYSVYRAPPEALRRESLSAQLSTGIRSIDSCIPLAYGQRIGIMAQAGVGKSMLLAMIAKHADIDIAVIALCGERGREVREFIEETLGADGLKKSVIVVSTSDTPSMVRQLAPFTATTIAEYFRDRGLRVLLVVDSLTRTARAIRDTGLASGEIPVRHGYPPSVYSELPKLLERAGTSERGSITALYTLLLENEDSPEPLAEEVKSLLDGHIILSGKLGTLGIRPSIKLTSSISRVIEKVLSSEQLSLRAKLLRALSRLERDRDLMLLGGTPDPELQAYLKYEPSIIQFLNQRSNEHSELSKTHLLLEKLVNLFTF